MHHGQGAETVRRASQNQVKLLNHAAAKLHSAHDNFNQQSTFGYISACEEIESAAYFAMGFWLHVHQVTSANPRLSDLFIFLESASEPVRGWLSDPYLSVFYLRTQLATHPDTLEEMGWGWRTAWTEEETRARLHEALTKLNQGITFLQGLIAPGPR